MRITRWRRMAAMRQRQERRERESEKGDGTEHEGVECIGPSWLDAAAGRRVPAARVRPGS